MSITGILIIIGCAVAGYWIVSSVMSGGVDVIEEGRKAARRESGNADDAQHGPAEDATGEGSLKALPSPRAESSAREWYIVLDVASNASRSEIQAALRRRLAQAEAAGDKAAVAQIRRAADIGLALKR